MDDRLEAHFASITREWVQEMFTLEHNDIALIDNPRPAIIDRGELIVFVADSELGIIGTCALIPVETGAFELTKTGVRRSARGRQAGQFLLSHVIARACSMEMRELFLLTNHRCEAAIHLYEKNGFEHDAEILRRYGPRYARCDVAMRYPL